MTQRHDLEPVAGRGIAAANGGSVKSRRLGQICIGAHTLSPEVALDKMRRIQQHSVSINAGAPVGGVSTINQEQAGVFEALKLKKPTQDTQLSLL